MKEEDFMVQYFDCRPLNTEQYFVIFFDME